MTVAAYRERWHTPVDHLFLGPDHTVEPVEALRDRRRARTATELAIKLSATLAMPKDDRSHVVETQSFQPTLTI